MKQLLGIEVTDEFYDYALCQQPKGYEIHKENGEIVLRKHIQTEEEKKQVRIAEINTRLTSLTQDFVQADCGEIIDDIEERKAEFVSLHNELRVLLGKEPRKVVQNVIQ